MLLYADVSEYLPTSESVGFRITVHDQWTVPFPDAFGYNAPTGFLSSFGVRMVSLKYPIASAVLKQMFDETTDKKQFFFEKLNRKSNSTDFFGSVMDSLSNS